MIKILALMGKSGAGKDTIQNLLLSRHPKQFHRIVSCTTRPIRENEIDGIHYKFLTEQEFLDGMMQELFIEALEFNGWFYGSMITSLHKDKINVGIFTPAGIEALYDTANAYNLDILPIYIEASDKTRLLRSLNREKNPDVKEICRRYQTDEEDFSDLNFNFISFWNDSDRMNKNETERFFLNHCKGIFL